MKTLTIFTPTYNRGYIINKAYESLKRQTNKDFIWLIIDDGSTDNTEEIVSKWIIEDIIEIKYVKKENGGKHTAYNLAVKVTNTELFFIALDSDDYLTDDAIEIVLKAWNENKHKGIAGVVALCSNYVNKKMIYKKFDKDKLNICSLQKAICENLFQGEAEYILKTEYAKKFTYPVVKGENFFTEAYTYYQMDEPLFWIHKSIYIRDYLDDGLTKNVFKGFIKNPNSYFLYNQIRIKYGRKFLLVIKHCIYYIAFGLLSSQKNIIKKSEKSFCAFFLMPFGFALYLIFKISIIKDKGI